MLILASETGNQRPMRIDCTNLTRSTYRRTGCGRTNTGDKGVERRWELVVLGDLLPGLAHLRAMRKPQSSGVAEAGSSRHPAAMGERTEGAWKLQILHRGVRNFGGLGIFVSCWN